MDIFFFVKTLTYVNTENTFGMMSVIRKEDSK